LKETVSDHYPEATTEISLQPLSDDESGILLHHLLPVDEASSERLSRIMDRAEGNPFYVEEIIRALLDSEALTQDKESGTWKIQHDFKELPIPDTLHGILLARVDRLDPSNKQTLQRAAVIGTSLRSL
jgi:predicted ATPase